MLKSDWEILKAIETNKRLIETCDRLLDEDYVNNFNKALDKYEFSLVHNMLKRYFNSNDKETFLMHLSVDKMLIPIDMKSSFSSGVMNFLAKNAYDSFKDIIKNIN